VGPGKLEPVVSPADIEAARRELVAAGRPHGQAALAAHLNVSRATIRRRMSTPA
jgi:hypothetical protein